MKKFIIGVLSLAFASCMSAAISLQINNASAQEEQNAAIFTETKCQISKTGDKMLMVTGITDVSRIYEVGYDISGGYQLTANDVAETNKYYDSLTLGEVTKTANEFLPGAEGLLIWEVAYDSAYAYTVTPYAKLGEFNESNQLIAPDPEVIEYGAQKSNFNVVTVTFADEEGTVITTKDVNIGATVSKIDAPEKQDYTFKGWYLDGEAYDFDAKVTSDLTLTAEYNAPAKYTVQVLTAEYAQGYASGYYSPGTLKYVDKTSEYASVFGLDENGQAKGIVDSTVDLTEKINTLKGAKLNEGLSNVKGKIAEDDALTLAVYLDFDEGVLGFGMDDIKIGDYSCDGLTFALAYMNGQCGLLIDGTIGNGKELFINVGGLDVSQYSSILLNWSEQSASKNTQIALVDNTDTLSSYYTVSIYSGALDLLTQFPDVTNIKTIRMKFIGGGQKTFFISGIEKKAFAKPSGTYNVANGNIMGIATPLNGVTLTTANHDFGEGSVSSLYYSYSGVDVQGDHQLGVIFDFNIKVSDYKSITIVYQSTDNNYTTDGYTGNGNGTAFWLNGTKYPDNYGGSAGGGVQTIDLIKLATDKGMTTISTFELQLNCKNATPGGNLWVSHIEFELAQS